MEMSWKELDRVYDQPRERELEKRAMKESIEASVNFALYHKCGAMISIPSPYDEDVKCPSCGKKIEDFDVVEKFF